MLHRNPLRSVLAAGRSLKEAAMHELLIALAFVGMVTCPAIVASLCRLEAEGDSEVEPGTRNAPHGVPVGNDSLLMEDGIVHLG
jgi:hypothetical protein